MRVGLLTTAFFGNLSGYFFGNFRYKASSIMRRPGECLEKTVIQGCIQGSRPRGRPARSWINDILEATNCTLGQLLRLTEDRQAWREMVHSASNHQHWWRIKKKKKKYYMTTCYPLLACDWLQNQWPRMTLSGYFTWNSVFALALLDSQGSTLKHNYVKINERSPYYQRQKCRSITLVSGNINHL